MGKTILITGATDGIGLETAKMLVSHGHNVLLHGRSPAKLRNAVAAVAASAGGRATTSHLADLSSMAEVATLAQAVAAGIAKLDVLINNAGVYSSPAPKTDDGFDVRFAVNTIAPYLLTTRLLPLTSGEGRVINVASAAQAPVEPLTVTAAPSDLPDGVVYAQSKLALIMWSRAMAASLGGLGPAVIAVNPGSMLGSKMVKQAFGVSGGDLGIGAEVLCRAALDDDFAEVSGQYFDNDKGRFASPHPAALEPVKCSQIVQAMHTALGE